MLQLSAAHAKVSLFAKQKIEREIFLYEILLARKNIKFQLTQECSKLNIIYAKIIHIFALKLFLCLPLIE